MESQSEDDEFDINACSDDENIIDRMLNDKKDIRVKIKTMTVIENYWLQTPIFLNIYCHVSQSEIVLFYLC